MLTWNNIQKVIGRSMPEPNCGYRFKREGYLNNHSESKGERHKINDMRVTIIHVGKIENGNPVDWSFDSYTDTPALSVSGRGILYYGYSLSELEEIARARPLQELSVEKACANQVEDDMGATGTWH